MTTNFCNNLKYAVSLRFIYFYLFLPKPRHNFCVLKDNFIKLACGNAVYTLKHFSVILQPNTIMTICN